jgi:hypothetical protein
MPNAECRMPNGRSPFAVCRSPLADSRQPTANSEQPTAHDIRSEFGGRHSAVGRQSPLTTFARQLLNPVHEQWGLSQRNYTWLSFIAILQFAA